MKTSTSNIVYLPRNKNVSMVFSVQATSREALVASLIELASTIDGYYGELTVKEQGESCDVTYQLTLSA